MKPHFLYSSKATLLDSTSSTERGNTLSLRLRIINLRKSILIPKHNILKVFFVQHLKILFKSLKLHYKAMTILDSLTSYPIYQLLMRSLNPWTWSHILLNLNGVLPFFTPPPLTRIGQWSKTDLGRTNWDGLEKWSSHSFETKKWSSLSTTKNLGLCSM